MTSHSSNPGRSRRNEAMKFAYAGPFVSRKIVTAARQPRPVIDRTSSGIPTGRKYAATSAESYVIGTQLDPDLVTALCVLFEAKPKRRRRKVAR